jgi:hypothetical protein
MDLSQLLQEQLTQQLSGGLMDQLTQQIGGADRQQTTAASGAIMSSLMEALAKNASTPDGASSLANALDRDHDGSVLDNLGSLLGGTMQQQTRQPQIPEQFRRSMNGAGILKHILGDQQENTMKEVSETSGLSLEKVGPLMVTLAPIVMGMLGRTKKSTGMDAGTLGGMLTDFMTKSQQPQARSNSPLGDIAGRLLDRDGDGSAVDDIVDLGTKMLGGFFRRK